MFIQPFFIQVAAAHVDSNTSKAVKGGIIGAGALIYLGVGVCHTFCRLLLQHDTNDAQP